MEREYREIKQRREEEKARLSLVQEDLVNVTMERDELLWQVQYSTVCAIFVFLLRVFLCTFMLVFVFLSICMLVSIHTLDSYSYLD